jgi:predicted Zn-dependent protease
LAAVKPDESVRVTVQNTPEDRRELSFALSRACHFQPHLLRSHVVNAAASGTTLHITTGMLDFLDSDTELAAVLAHELAHSVMSHTAKRQGNQLLGKSLDTVLGAAAGPAGGLLVRILAPGQRLIGAAYSQDFEREADYVAMYVLALAGYRLDEAPKLWRKLAVEFPNMLEHSYLGTHPATAERVLLQVMTIDEIGAKVAAREPLLPEIEKRLGEMKRGTE